VRLVVLGALESHGHAGLLARSLERLEASGVFHASLVRHHVLVAHVRIQVALGRAHAPIAALAERPPVGVVMTPGPLRAERGLVHTGEAVGAGHRRRRHGGRRGGLGVRGTRRGHAVVEICVRRGHRGLHLSRAHGVVIRALRTSRFAVGALSGLLRRRRQRVSVAVHHLDSERVGQGRREQLRVGAGELLRPRQALFPRPHHLRGWFPGGRVSRFLLPRLRGGLLRGLALIRLGHHRRHGSTTVAAQ